MADRELIEAAAKATGRTVTDWLPNAGPGLAGIGCDVARLDDGSFFQPLHENRLTDCMGDALRLAVRLGMALHLDHYGDTGVTVESGELREHGFYESSGSDPDAATRRAIVRAAAALAGTATGEKP